MAAGRREARVREPTGVAPRALLAEVVRRARAGAPGLAGRVELARGPLLVPGRAGMRTRPGAGQHPLEAVRTVDTVVPAGGRAVEPAVVDPPPAGAPMVGAVRRAGPNRAPAAPTANARGRDRARHGPDRLDRLQRVQVQRLRVLAGPGAQPGPVAPASAAGATSALGADLGPAAATGGVLAVAVRVGLVRVVLGPVAHPIAVAMIVVHGPGPRAEPSVPRVGPSRRRQLLSFETRAALARRAVAPARPRHRCAWCAARVGPLRRRPGVGTRT